MCSPRRPGIVADKPESSGHRAQTGPETEVGAQCVLLEFICKDGKLMTHYRGVMRAAV